MRTSEPVSSRATRGTVHTGTSSRPATARNAACAGESTAPARTTVSPSAHSVPAGRMCLPASSVRGLPGDSSRSSPRRVANSSRMTVVVLSGITPPVTTGTAVPGASVTADAALGSGADGAAPSAR